MSERKLIAPDPGPAFAEGMARSELPTEEQRKRAMEKAFCDVIREDLHRDALPAGVPTTTKPSKLRNTTGWQNDVPIGPPPGISLIDQIANAMLPHAPKNPLSGVDLEKVRERLENIKKPDDDAA